jgi:hypothetical protein
VTDLEAQLRELCACYEWAEPPNLPVAGVLQNATDAFPVGALSPEAAKALITVWKPFVGREAAIGNPPKMIALQDDTIGALMCAVKDLRRMLNEASEDSKPRLAELLRQQASILEKHEKGTPWKAAV